MTNPGGGNQVKGEFMVNPGFQNKSGRAPIWAE